MSELCAYIDLKISNFINSVWTQRQWFHNMWYRFFPPSLMVTVMRRQTSCCGCVTGSDLSRFHPPSCFWDGGWRSPVIKGISSDQRTKCDQLVGSTLRSGFSPVTRWIRRPLEDPGPWTLDSRFRWITLSSCYVFAWAGWPRCAIEILLPTFSNLKMFMATIIFPKMREMWWEKQTLRTKAAPHFIYSWASGGQCESVSHRRHSSFIIELRMLHFSVEKREYNPPKNACNISTVWCQVASS